jgi:PAS domain S-box-containing protein
MDELSSLLGRHGFLPHGYCFTWAPALLWPMVASDLFIAAAYFSIPATLVHFVRQRRETTLRGTAWLFSAFIFACGMTHLMDVWTIWRADYALQLLSKAVTAVISVVTAVALWRMVPEALKIPSVGDLQAVIQRLEAEVAQRRSAEESLAEVQQNLAVTLSSIGAGFLATDREGKVTRMNSVAEQILGWKAAEAQGQPLWQVFDREDRPPGYLERNPVDVLAELGLAVDSAQHVTAIARDGRRTALEVKAALTRANDGSLRGMAIVFRDMTAVMRAEVESARLAAIVEWSNDAIISKSLDGRITGWNAAAERLFGYSAEEAIGQPVQMLIPDDRQAEEMAILSDLSHGRLVPAFETQRRHRGGRLIDVSISISPIRDARGQVVGASKIARDIAPLKQAEQARLRAQQLEAENRQIQEANRLKSQFLANMSHELRTPLNAIIGFADLLQLGVGRPDSAKQREYLGHIAGSGRHLLQLINDVLDLSKVESGKFEFVPEPVQLPLLVQEVCGVLQGALQRKHLVLHTELDPAVHGLVLDPARLKQALFNYLSNAIKFTPDRGRITVRALPEGATRWRLEVEDTGIGIAAADLPRLFTEFQQLDSSFSKQHAGTGLGLALTRRLVEAQGGTVGVRSTPGVGSVFHLVLDRVPQPVVTAQRVLVIEDDASHLSWLAQALSAAGFVVDSASTAAQALHKAGAQAYGAITLDLRLPEPGGLALLARIRDQGLSRASPVLGLSLPGGEAAPASPALFAVADVIFKPLRGDEVVQALSRLPGGRPARVMVVDDDPLARQLMSATLDEAGITAVCVDGGREALRELALQRPDAMILDLMMPGFDGFETLDALRQLPQGEQLPVLIWTSMLLTDEEIVRLTRSAGTIIGKGGGQLAGLLASLQRWQPTGTATAEASS